MADVKKEAEFAFVPSHTYSLKSLNEVPHFEVLTQIIFEQNEQGDRIVDVLLAKCIKRGHLTLYARTEQSQLLVYDVDFFGGYNSARLISVVQHMEYFTNQQLYSTYMFQPEPFKANDLHLLNEILKGQLNSLSDCIALVADGVLHNYYNGVLIASRTLQGIVTQTNNTLYVNGNDISFPPLINDPIDSLILRTLELSFEDDRYFMKCLTQYCAGSPIF